MKTECLISRRVSGGMQQAGLWCETAGISSLPRVEQKKSDQNYKTQNLTRRKSPNATSTDLISKTHLMKRQKCEWCFKESHVKGDIVERRTVNILDSHKSILLTSLQIRGILETSTVVFHWM